MPTLHRPSSARAIFIGLLLIGGVVVWSGVRFWQSDQSTSDPAPETSPEDVSLVDVRFLSAKELLEREKHGESLLFVDIRSPESFTVTHIVDSVSVPAIDLEAFQPSTRGLVILVTDSEIPNTTIKKVHELLTARNFSFAFLEGGLTAWIEAGGKIISQGDPLSAFDYTKVIFIEPEKVPEVAASLVRPVFLDVRSPSDYTRGHIPDAINIPLADLERRRKDIPTQASLFVYGDSDYTSYQGAVRLFDLGFFGSRAIRGGYAFWQDRKLPVTTDK